MLSCAISFCNVYILTFCPAYCMLSWQTPVNVPSLNFVNPGLSCFVVWIFLASFHPIVGLYFVNKVLSFVHAACSLVLLLGSPSTHLCLKHQIADYFTYFRCVEKQLAFAMKSDQTARIIHQKLLWIRVETISSTYSLML